MLNRVTRQGKSDHDYIHDGLIPPLPNNDSELCMKLPSMLGNPDDGNTQDTYHGKEFLEDQLMRNLEYLV